MLDGEPATAFGTTGADHCATTTRAHAHEKAVSAFTAHNRRLIGAFHGGMEVLVSRMRANARTQKRAAFEEPSITSTLGYRVNAYRFGLWITHFKKRSHSGTIWD